MKREDLVQKLLIAVEFEENDLDELDKLAKHINKFEGATTKFIGDITHIPERGLTPTIEDLRVHLNMLHTEKGIDNNFEEEFGDDD